MLPAGIPINADQALILKTADDFARARVAPGAAQRDVDRAFPAELLREMAELGLLGMKVSPELGGAGADMTSYALAIAAVSRACASTGVTLAVCNLAADILAKHGSNEVKTRYLAPYLEGRLGAGTFCLSEPGCGSDASALAATATLDGDHYVLNGTKQWITNGAHAGIHVLFARVVEPGMPTPTGSKGITCFVVERGTPGLVVAREEHKMGLRASNTVQLSLQDVRVPKQNVVGEVGRGYSVALGFLDGGRIGIAAQCLGIMQAAIDAGVEYANDRKAFGKPLSNLNAIQNFIADSAVDYETSWLLTMRAAHARDGGHGDAHWSSVAKVFASEACGRVVDRMLQVHGGYGYVEDYAIERLYRDARVTRIYEGTSEVQRILVARSVLGL
jgi:alkylation response protein AidB-like acyl-CoA dehydrogenase